MSQMPDKIWLHKDTKYSTADEVCGYQYEFAQEIEYEGIENFVEYVPANAFIEKVCEKLKNCMYDNLMFQGRLHRKEVIETFIEDFKKYMEE